MLDHVRVNLLLLVLTLVICSALYPLALLAVGQGLFPANASGSLITGADGKPIGSRLIAAEFKGDEWFHPRPSAADYNAAASSGSNLSANNPKLRQRAASILQARRASRRPRGRRDGVRLGAGPAHHPAERPGTAGSRRDRPNEEDARRRGRSSPPWQRSSTEPRSGRWPEWWAARNWSTSWRSTSS